MSDRSMNLQDYVEARLQEWGRWCKQTGIPNLAYSPLSNVGRIHAFGGVFIEGAGGRIGSDNPSAEEIEAWLLELKFQYPQEAVAIIQYYASNHDKEYLARKTKPKSITVRAFNHRIKSGKLWLEGRMSERTKKYEKNY